VGPEGKKNGWYVGQGGKEGERALEIAISQEGEKGEVTIELNEGVEELCVI